MARGSGADHCPFLNRHEARCGEHMSLRGLHHAFDYCFGRYRACAVYRELFGARSSRRGLAAATQAGAALHGNSPVSLTINRRAIETAGSAARHANAA